MNKRELAAAIAEKTGLSKSSCKAMLDAFVVTIGNALKSGDKVRLAGFGTFKVKERATRTGRNPRAKEFVDIPASRQPTFKPGKALKESVL